MSELHRCLLKALLREKLGVAGNPIGKLILVHPIVEPHFAAECEPHAPALNQAALSDEVD